MNRSASHECRHTFASIMIAAGVIAGRPDRLALVEVNLAAVAEIADPSVVVEWQAVAQRVLPEPR